MLCPYCNRPGTKVVDSRQLQSGRTIRRRRECLHCHQRFSTKESVQILQLTVVKRNKDKEEYRPDKIKHSLSVATNKRLKKQQLDKLIDEVEGEIFARGKKQIESKKIGEIILRNIQKIDEVSYLRYASVFKSFGSGQRFIKEVDKI